MAKEDIATFLLALFFWVQIMIFQIILTKAKEAAYHKGYTAALSDKAIIKCNPKEE